MYQSRWADPPPPAPPVSAEEDKNNELQPTVSLSASAPSFEPAPSPQPPPPDVASADTFAQTGAGQDDLFDDVMPVDESMRLRSEDDLFSDDFTPVPQPVVEQSVQSAVRAEQRDTGPSSRSRGRGQGGRGGAQSRQDSSGVVPQATSTAHAQPPANTEASEPIPTGPKEARTSTRRDRQNTGGVRKPKLSEAQLAEKMAQISVKNAELTAAHARAEADAASFAHRESEAKAQAEQKKKEERRDRQQMMGERERNRMRKLKAMEGREWDSEKREEDFDKGGRFDQRGGFGRDQSDYSDGREYLYQERRSDGKRERAGRGGRGGRGGSEQAAAPPRQEDFPALPGKVGKEDLKAVEGDSKASWADQVESAT